MTRPARALPPELLEALAESQARGLVGPGPLEPQVQHALAMGEAAGGPPDGVAVDLGAGGGLPGLVLAWSWPTSRWLLLDSRERSVAFLAEAVAALALEDRVDTRLGRAEDAGRDATWRGRAALVVARGFGPAAVTAECAAPLLRVGGRMVVSEPPGSEGGRWPAQGLASLGMHLERVEQVEHGTFAVVEQTVTCPSRYPRRAGIPRKRPVWVEPRT